MSSLFVYNNSICFVIVAGSFAGEPDFGVSASVGYDVHEGTRVTFTCKANVGAEPPGQILWSYTIGNTGISKTISDKAVKGRLLQYETCSFTQTSTVQLTMTQRLNGVRVRCTLQQNNVSVADSYRETSNFNVSCKYSYTCKCLLILFFRFICLTKLPNRTNYNFIIKMLVCYPLLQLSFVNKDVHL